MYMQFYAIAITETRRNIANENTKCNKFHIHVLIRISIYLYEYANGKMHFENVIYMCLCTVHVVPRIFINVL